MTMTEPRPAQADTRRARAAADPDRCSQCGAPLDEDQEWCLECGSSRTLIYTAPDWRVPVAIVLVVILLAIAGFAFALVRLSNNTANAAERHATQAVTDIARLNAAPSALRSPAAAANRVPAISSWSVGLSGWTVVLARYPARADAYARARMIAPTGTPVGVFDSSEHPAMTPGYWVVFSGRFPNRSLAATSAARLIAEGYTTAAAREVSPPGGL